MQTRKSHRRTKASMTGHRPKKLLNRLLEDTHVTRVSYDQYRSRVRRIYGGAQGAILSVCSRISLHLPLGRRLFGPGRFDLSGARQILDVGSGAGQLVEHVLKYSDPDSRITCFDLSPEMLRRAQRRLDSPRPRFVVADLARLPFADASFDRVTCGFVLEHLPDARLGLAELARVMQPGARMLLLTTEDNFSGALTSRAWSCRTYNRGELAAICEELGLSWHRELWYTPLHKVLRAGGICVELVKN